jgi:hypothetical protein|tara:strand:- start:1147 stop:1263 length:117 start_codon:yes stop_codon:yes gene_type:complete
MKPRWEIILNTILDHAIFLLGAAICSGTLWLIVTWLIS